MFAALIFSVVSVAPKPQPPPVVKTVVALVELKGLVADADRLAVDERLRALLPNFGLDVQPKTRTQQAQKDLNKLGLCSDAGSVECLVQVGALSKARVVLAGVVSPGADGAMELALVAVDVGSMHERGRVKVVVAKDAPGDDPIESALVGLLRPEEWLGSLRISVAQRGASIYVDGAPRGFAPLAEPLDLLPGPHALFIGLEGFQAHKETVDITYKKESAVDVVLTPGETEPPPHFAAAVEPAAPAPVVKKTPLRVVMYDVDAVDVEKRVAHIVGQLLVAEMRKRERVSVLDSDELHTLVGNGKSTAVDARHCDAAECFAEVADALGADVVVIATLTNIHGEILFGLRRVDAHKQEVAGTFVARVPADDTSALLPLVGKSVATVFGDAALRPGQRSGVDDRAARVLNPPPLSPLLAGSLYVGAGISAATAAALFVTATVVGLSYSAQLDVLAAPPAAGAHVNKNENASLAPLATTWAASVTGGVVALGAGAAFGLGGFVTGLFTDWDNDAATAPAGAP